MPRYRDTQPAQQLACLRLGLPAIQPTELSLQLRRARVMGAERIELSGFTDAMRERLKAMGLISEIISWKLRLFVPTGADGPNVLARLMERHKLLRVGERHAA